MTYSTVEYNTNYQGQYSAIRIMVLVLLYYRPIRKMAAINYSFICIYISLTSLVYVSAIQKNLWFINEAIKANLDAYKRIIKWQPFFE